MIRLRPLVACLLSRLLVFGSLLGSVARNQMTGVTDVTLCGTGGAAVLQVDALDNPVKPRPPLPAPPCPHCLAASTVASLSAPPRSPGPGGAAPDPVLPGLAAAWPPAQSPGPSARGPPLTV